MFFFHHQTDSPDNPFFAPHSEFHVIAIQEFCRMSGDPALGVFGFVWSFNQKCRGINLRVHGKFDDGRNIGRCESIKDEPRCCHSRNHGVPHGIGDDDESTESVLGGVAFTSNASAGILYLLMKTPRK